MFHPSGMCYELANVRGNPNIEKFDRSGLWGSKLDGRAKKHVYNRVAALWRLSGYECYFYTFTLPVLQHLDEQKTKFKEGLTDKDVGNLFSTCLENLSKNYNFKSYVFASKLS